MKKVFAAALALITVISLTTVFSSALYTDFDSWENFTAGGNPCYNSEDAADYWIGEWDSGGQNGLEAAEIVDAKGIDGSKALAIHEDGTDNVGLYLFGAKSGIPTDYTGALYLRVWMDLTDVGFRKANWGVIDSTYSLFTTDEVDADGLPFYYLADGGDSWVEMAHGGDGCFGDAQNSDVTGFKGYFAFPVSDFWIRSNCNWEAVDEGTAANVADICGVYLFWDYSESLNGGEIFYVDNIDFVADYTYFEPVVVETEPTAETEPPAVVETAAPAAQPAPQTADPLALTLIATLAAVAIIPKKRR